MALKGALEFCAKKGKHIITSPIEHKAIIDTARWIERQGGEVTWLPVNSDGLIEAAEVEKAIRPDTVLVSLMHGNNEIGVLNPLAEIGAICKKHGVLFHTDAAQTAGKVPIDVEAMGIDMLSLSGHKCMTKGIGALYVRRKPRVRISPLLMAAATSAECDRHLAGAPNRGTRRSGRACKAEIEDAMAHAERLRDRLLWKTEAEVPEILVNGSMQHRLPGNLNISFTFVEGESLLMALRDVAARGSACTSASLSQVMSFVPSG